MFLSQSIHFSVELSLSSVGKKQALLVFSALVLRIGKTKCACLCGGYFVCCPTVGGMKSCRLRAISYQVTQKLERATTFE